MLEKNPSEKELIELIGNKAYDAWRAVENFVNEKYNMDVLWDKNRGENIYEMKFRKSGKTLCSMYARKGSFGFMVIYGKTEREKFEEEKFSSHVGKIYDETKTFHDGKWVMLDIKDLSYIEDMKKMILIKKKPNKKV